MSTSWQMRPCVLYHPVVHSHRAWRRGPSRETWALPTPIPKRHQTALHSCATTVEFQCTRIWYRRVEPPSADDAPGKGTRAASFRCRPLSCQGIRRGRCQQPGVRTNTGKKYHGHVFLHMVDYIHKHQRYRSFKLGGQMSFHDHADSLRCFRGLCRTTQTYFVSNA